MTRRYPGPPYGRRLAPASASDARERAHPEVRERAPGAGNAGPRRPGGPLLDGEDGLGFGPVLLEAVVVALGRGEHVDDDRAEIE
jgi:hypothetical protein